MTPLMDVWVFDAEDGAAIQELSVPVINIGPWGKDFHKSTERVYVPDLCERTPALILAALQYVFGQSKLVEI